jgi:hypothetical protein
MPMSTRLYHKQNDTYIQWDKSCVTNEWDRPWGRCIILTEYEIYKVESVPPYMPVTENITYEE